MGFERHQSAAVMHYERSIWFWNLVLIFKHRHASQSWRTWPANVSLSPPLFL